ncbi:MAG TPA: PilZ domain-containing protein [Desulfuromonadales bacterium]|nr:PilZ domain-containing protein [Desulfuromonadales bacterium]
MGNRMFSRVKFNVNATITAGTQQFQGTVENLSMTGMLLNSPERLAEGERVEITIALTGTLPEITISFSGNVSRTLEDGLAFTFDKIDLDSYMHLKNIIAYNSDDAEKVMDEICHSIDTRLTAHT